MSSKKREALSPRNGDPPKRHQISEKEVIKNRLAKFREDKSAKKVAEKVDKPAWRPVGKASSTFNFQRPTTRSQMTKSVSSSKLLPGLPDTKKRAKKTSVEPQIKHREAGEDKENIQTLPKPLLSEAEANPKGITKAQVPVPSGLTPIRKAVQRVDLNDQKDENSLEKKLNLKYWKEHQSSQKKVVETMVNKLKGQDKTNTSMGPFWEEHLRVLTAEGELLLGRKSRLHKFLLMLEKPLDVEGGLGITSEDDLICYWEAQIAPVITDWTAKTNWFLNAAKIDFPEPQKSLIPAAHIGKSPAKPPVKPTDHLGRRAININQDPEAIKKMEKKKAEAEEKASKMKKELAERRKKMKAMMMEKKRQLSEKNTEETSELP